ncbi:probable polygalacturonase At3g15720 [Mangifera indica]|uniref:probable polygalacturonase At3g15720 n=1 Tax=Mangifera indica TaxID=29780 RepID=UPI001CF9BD3D|nr:probable polygalacturonase At3g15720 [Mangifera indica]
MKMQEVLGAGVLLLLCIAIGYSEPTFHVAPDTISGWNGSGDYWLGFDNVNGLVINGSGTINGRGSTWWSRSQESTRPRAVHFDNCNNQVTGISVVNSPMCHISINQCTGVSISRIHINSPADSPNTDGIDIASSTYVDVRNSIIKSD